MNDHDELIAQAQRLNIRPEALHTYLSAATDTPAPGVVRSLHTTVKAVGSACNLDCSYCYYLSKEGLLQQRNQRLDEALLERFIVDYIAATDSEEIQFTWHGGEPTLLGVDYFRKVVELQRRHTPAGRRVSNDLQTNGTLLDEEWGAFLAEHDFLVGISIDGPRALHDRYRSTKRGESSFDAVMRGVRILQRHALPFSTLSVVNRDTAQQGLAVYRFLRDEVGTRYMQFIPCVEPREFASTSPTRLAARQLVHADSPRAQPDHPLSVVTAWSVAPLDWGRFLVAAYDEWDRADRGRIKVNLFETLFAQLRGEPAQICTSSPFCGKNVALEQDGQVYSCDHFVYPEHALGQIGKRPLKEMVFSLKQLEFGLDKFNSLPTECRQCPYLKLCWGECPRTRILAAGDSGQRISYLCTGWKHFFAHVLPRTTRHPRQETKAPR